jgi:CheY-like chemotaxis protein
LEIKVSAVLKDPELIALKAGLNAMGAASPVVSVFQTDLEALQMMYVQGRPDVFVVDLDLPGVTGIETVKAMRQQAELSALPLILLSSREVPPAQRPEDRALFLVKPVLTGTWQDAVKRSLSGETQSAPKPAVEDKAAAPSGPPPDRGEARRAARQRWQAPCVIGTHTRKLKGIIRDISASGARVTVQQTFAVPAVIILTFAPPSDGAFKIMTMKARLVRLTKDGYGLQFLEMDGPTRFFINKLTGKQSL